MEQQSTMYNPKKDNKMAKTQKNGVALSGTLETSGVTFYTRNGKTVMRSASSNQPKRRSREQFIGRARIAHATKLWKALKWQVQPLFTGGTNAYTRFMSLMSKVPVVYMPAELYENGGSLLLPGMPVSEGMLPAIDCQLGEVEGRPALITNLPHRLNMDDRLRLYTITQRVDHGTPRVGIYAEEQIVGKKLAAAPFKDTEVRLLDGGVAFVGNVFADEMKGWALMLINGERCSTQQVVTRCTVYERYTTEAALLEAAASYGGLTGK